MIDPELKESLQKRIDVICEILSKGKDVELRRDVCGVKVISVEKRVVKE